MDEDSFNEKLSQLTDEQEAAAEYESTAATNAPAEGVKRPSSSPSGGGDDREQMLPATKRSRDTSEETEGINAMTDTGAAAGVELLPPPAEPTGDTAGLEALDAAENPASFPEHADFQEDILTHLMLRGLFREAWALARVNKEWKSTWDSLSKKDEAKKEAYKYVRGTVKYVRIMRQCVVLQTKERAEEEEQLKKENCGQAAIQSAASAEGMDERNRRRIRLCRRYMGADSGFWNFLFRQPPILHSKPRVGGDASDGGGGGGGGGSSSSPARSPSLCLSVARFSASVMDEITGAVKESLKKPSDVRWSSSLSSSSSSSSLSSSSSQPLGGGARAKAISDAISTAEDLLRVQGGSAEAKDFWTVAATSVLCCHSAEVR